MGGECEKGFWGTRGRNYVLRTFLLKIERFSFVEIPENVQLLASRITREALDGREALLAVGGSADALHAIFAHSTRRPAYRNYCLMNHW